MRIVVLLCLVAACVYAAPPGLLHEEWTAYKLEHGVRYGSAAEETRAREAFELNRLTVARHNQRHALGLESFRLGINQYSDLAPSDFSRRMNGFRPSARRNRTRAAGGAVSASSLPGHKDWVTEGAVTPVKDQLLCGSCWAFATAGALEGQTLLKYKYIVSLSAQNLVDCSLEFGNDGCEGGNADDAFMYVHNQGLASDSQYPYEARVGTCRFNQSDSKASDDGFIDLPFGDEMALQSAVATVGPVAAAIDANGAFQHYKSGVYYNATCSDTNHAVLVVGYGTDERAGDYWLIKNSWGETWGERGYGRVARNRDNNCGIASFASYPYVY